MESPTTVTGTPEDGQTLTADPGTWSGTGPLTYDYQWQRCADDGTACADVPGATDPTYTLTPGDVGHPVRVEVTATNAGGAATASSDPSAGVAVDPPASTSPAGVTGTAVDGQTLTADPGTWTGTRTLMYNLTDPQHHRRGLVRACGDAQGVACTAWIYPDVCDAACDRAAPGAGGSMEAIPPTSLRCRTIGGINHQVAK